MNLRELTMEVQKASGLIDNEVDGKWGVQSATAALKKLKPDQLPEEPIITVLPDSIDERSRLNINTLQTWVRPVAAKFLEGCLAAGIPVKIISGWRTDVEQERLYAQGRSTPGRIVTNARAGYSNHNYGLAFDTGIFSESGLYLEESPLYTSAGEIGKKLGLAWGGDWDHPDEPHFELRPEWAKTLSENEMLTILRRRKSKGESYA